MTHTYLKFIKKLIPLIIVLLFASFSYAHECFIFAYNFIVKEGDNLRLHLFIADGLNIQHEKPLQKNITKKYVLINEKGKIDLLKTTADAKLPIAEFKVDFKGLGLIVMERDYVEIALPNNKFLEYLKSDHIEDIKIDRSKPEQKERYTRYIKTLIQSNLKLNDTLYRSTVGAKFEIVLLNNPYLLQKGNRLKAKVLFDGKPLANKVITARNRVDNEPAIADYSRTDQNGICSFKLKREGEWLIHTTHMVSYSDKNLADWESFWATFSFGVYNH